MSDNNDTVARAPRSWLYVPAHDRRKVEKASTVGADAVILDFEDGTPLALKSQAREVARDALENRPDSATEFWVRINAVEDGSPWRDDLDTIASSSRVSGVVVPKVESADQLEQVSRELTSRGSSLPLSAIVTETVSGALAMGATLSASANTRFAFWGTEDLQSDLGATRIRDESGNLVGAYAVVEGMFLLEARRANVGAVDTPTLTIDDLETVARESERAAQFGFAGRQVIHPKHIDIVNEAFLPSREQVENATAIVDAFGSDTSGAHRVADGMVDTPHLRSALRILNRAQQYGVKSRV